MKLVTIALSLITIALFSCHREDQVNTVIPENALGYIDEAGEPQVLKSKQHLVDQLSDKIGLAEPGEIDAESVWMEFDQESQIGYLYFHRTTEAGHISSAIRLRESAGFMLPIAEEHTCSGSPCEDCDFTYNDDGTIDGCECGDTTSGGGPKGFCNHTVSSGGF
ncbi:MAG: hypothetical protein AAFQ98_00225 [Bacteroidota bacterium]